MNEFKGSLLLSMLLATPAAWSQTASDGPIADLQDQIIDLTQRVATLEAATPTASVEGRTYCFVLDLTMMQGISVNQTENLVTSIIRRTATFDGGMFEATLSSHVRNTQSDNGVVTPSVESSPDPLFATYVQTGNRLDMSFSNGTAVTWYVSKDGSLISGTSIRFLGPLGVGQVTLGQTRHYTLIEGEYCAAELM